MSDLADLKRRVEEATGPDRELDALIRAAFFTSGREWPKHLPRYTASLDATVALIERVMSGKTWIILNRAMQAVSDRHKKIVFGINADEIVRAALSALLSACEQGGAN